MDWSVTIHTVDAEVTGDEAEAVVDLLFDVRGVVIHGARGELGVTVTRYCDVLQGGHRAGYGSSR